MEKDIFVFQDEDANYCVIVGTTDIKRAEKALRDQEEEWFGKDHKEEAMPIDEFQPTDIYYGEKSGEEYYYWGDKPQIIFDEGKFEKLDGFVGSF